MHFRLFDRPLIIDDPLSSIYIDGQYADYVEGSAYEGRVQIHGSVGYTTVEILSSNLPPGAYAYVDNVFKQVVVKWPAYTPPVDTFTLLENGDFAKGDTGAWTNTGEGNPFVIEPDSNGQMSMKFKSGFSGGHYSESPLAPITDINRQITATGRIAQGKSSKRKLWGGIVLVFHDKDRNYLNHLESNWVNSGGDYKDVKVVAAASNVLAKFVSVRIHFDRKGQNHPGWADDIKWDHVWTQGYDKDADLFVEVRVKDALNNTATHRGTIGVKSNWFTSLLYPQVAQEYLFASVSDEGPRVLGIPESSDSTTAQSGPAGFTLEETTRYLTLTQGVPEPVALAVSAPQGFTLVTTTSYQTFTAVQQVQATSIPVFTMKIEPVYTLQQFANLTSQPEGFTLS